MLVFGKSKLTLLKTKLLLLKKILDINIIAFMKKKTLLKNINLVCFLKKNLIRHLLNGKSFIFILIW